MRNQTRKVDIIVSINQGDVDTLEEVSHRLRNDCMNLRKRGVVPKSTIKRFKNSVIKGCIFSLGLKELEKMGFLDVDKYCKENALYEREH